jgi:hypothetical protein
MGQIDVYAMKELEYKEVLSTYRHYFDLAGKCLTIYLVVLGACLTLPFTFQVGSPDQLKLFKEMCRVFAFVVSIGAIAAYAIGAIVATRLGSRQQALAIELGITPQDTWLLPTVIWIAIAIDCFLLILLARYT